MQDTAAPAAPEEPSATDFSGWMQRGITLHQQGKPEQALLAFEKAHALEPTHVNAASARAALLTELLLPIAAYKALLLVEASLLQDADGAANLGIAAEACGDLDKARMAYGRALELDARHVRALNNLALLAAQAREWDDAIAKARLCVALEPLQATHHANLSDFLCGARQDAQALEAVRQGLTLLPGEPGLVLRHMAVLAFNGEIEASNAVFHSLDAVARQHAQAFVAAATLRAKAASGSVVQPEPSTDQALDARRLFSTRVYESMAMGDWRKNEQLAALVRRELLQGTWTAHSGDWSGLQFHGPLLGMNEVELEAIHRLSAQTAPAADPNAVLPKLAPSSSPARGDERLRIGIAVQNLADESYVKALKQQLDLHDPARFAIYIYSPGREVAPGRLQQLGGGLTGTGESVVANVVESGHFTDVEAAGRMRLDRLDIFMDMTLNTPSHRPAIAALRVAPVQLQPVNLQRQQHALSADYAISDSFIHPEGLDMTPFGAVVRLPCTRWLATGSLETEVTPTRPQAGLPEDTMLLCCSAPAILIDPESFSLWMQILQSLPHAVLWLPRCTPQAAVHLVREAAAAGMEASRLLFTSLTPMNAPGGLAALAHADLFLDTVRFNAGDDVVLALRAGVPVISCAGRTMASRMGGSILRAAGLGDCVVGSTQAYVMEAVRLGHDPSALKGLKERLSTVGTSPLFDIGARIREWETAWTVMAQRTRAGLPPAAFDVPASGNIASI